MAITVWIARFQTTVRTVTLPIYGSSNEGNEDSGLWLSWENQYSKFCRSVACPWYTRHRSPGNLFCFVQTVRQTATIRRHINILMNYYHEYVEISGSHSTSIKMTVFWDAAPCSLAETDRRFRGTYCPPSCLKDKWSKRPLTWELVKDVGSHLCSSIYIWQCYPPIEATAGNFKHYE
jgi:hypothetical protein